ncbi:MAG: 2-oxo acid dehydrogenase subunit E2 [Proteobacteria bacterium]|nr:2-oxo acid dehydrogenase subunit E2 [Pseudomonadota bacterium]
MDFKLPDIGEGIHEGEIVKWIVKQGEKVAADQPMVEVMTDKATVEIPSPIAGTIDTVFAKEGETIEVGKVLVVIREEGKAEAAPAPAQKTAPKAATPASREVTPIETAESKAIPFDVLATPATRKLARDLDVDISTVKGSGLHGRVTKEDVQMAASGQEAAAPRPSHTAVSSTSVVPHTFQTVPAPQRGALQTIPLRGVRKKIAEAMQHSKRTAAHFTYVEEVDMSAVVALRASVLEEAKRREVKLSYLPFIIKALIPCLQEFPYLNSSLDDEKEQIVLKGDYNIGIATDTPNGLIVPVIKNADQKNIWQLASEISVLAEKARTGKVALDDLKGGTFTITNAGSIGGVFATPVINHPEVAILGVNAIRKRPVVKGDQIAIADMMFLSLSVDHRVVDGADAARFMNRMVFFLSEPTRLVFA